MSLDDYPILGLRPRGLLDPRVQVIVPSLPALLADPTLEVSRYQRPLFRAVFIHQLDHFLILLRDQAEETLKRSEKRSVRLDTLFYDEDFQISR